MAKVARAFFRKARGQLVTVLLARDGDRGWSRLTKSQLVRVALRLIDTDTHPIPDR